MNIKREEMQKAIKHYAKWSKSRHRGKWSQRWPKALREVERSRNKIETYAKVETNYAKFHYSKITSEYHVDLTYQKFLKKTYHDILIECEKELFMFKSVKSIEDPTTLRTDMITEDVSFK